MILFQKINTKSSLKKSFIFELNIMIIFKSCFLLQEKFLKLVLLYFKIITLQGNFVRYHLELYTSIYSKIKLCGNFSQKIRYERFSILFCLACKLIIILWKNKYYTV